MNELMKTIPLHKSLILIFVALLTMGLTVCLGTGNTAVLAGPRKQAPTFPCVGIRNALVFAQNRENKVSEREKNGSSPERIESDSKTGTKPKKNDLPSVPESKPLKSFVPSEKIRADQAVDFPYDI